MVPWVNGPFPVRLWRGNSGNWATPTRGTGSHPGDQSPGNHTLETRTLETPALGTTPW